MDGSARVLPASGRPPAPPPSKGEILAECNPDLAASAPGRQPAPPTLLCCCFRWPRSLSIDVDKQVGCGTEEAMQTVYGRKAWLVWAASIVVYIVAMMHRSSLGVAGLKAAEHFGTTAGIVSTFVVLQLTTYALAQLPAGALLDRYGCSSTSSPPVSRTPRSTCGGPGCFSSRSTPSASRASSSAADGSGARWRLTALSSPVGVRSWSDTAGRDARARRDLPAGVGARRTGPRC